MVGKALHFLDIVVEYLFEKFSSLWKGDIQISIVRFLIDTIRSVWQTDDSLWFHATINIVQVFFSESCSTFDSTRLPSVEC